MQQDLHYLEPNLVYCDDTIKIFFDDMGKLRKQKKYAFGRSLSFMSMMPYACYTNFHYINCENYLTIELFKERKSLPHYVEMLKKIKEGITIQEFCEEYKKLPTVPYFKFSDNAKKKYKTALINDICLPRHIVRYAQNTAYFFNEEGIYEAKEIKVKDLWEEKILPGIGISKDIQHCVEEIQQYISGIMNCKVMLVKRVLSNIVKPGDSIEYFSNLLSTLTLNDYQQLNNLVPFDYFVTSIGKPDIRKSPNTSKNSFDYISIEIFLRTSTSKMSKEALEADIRKYLPEMKKRVVGMIQKSKEFNKYGVPINILKLSKISYYKNFNSLEMIFEIKEI